MAGGDEAGDLDGLIGRVDPDRWLTSRFIADPVARADVIALYAFDYELARARQVASNPLIAEIRLTWWREALDESFSGGPVRRHPVAAALAAAVRRHSLPRAPLEAMIDGQIEALHGLPSDAASAERWADAVEGSAARLAAIILGEPAPADAAAPAGRAWGLALLRRAGAESKVIGAPLSRALVEARRSLRILSVAAQPAALPARVARFDLAGKRPGRLRLQTALILAAASGRV